MRAALVASCLRGALPPVDLRAVCLVRAMVLVLNGVWSVELELLNQKFEFTNGFGEILR